MKTGIVRTWHAWLVLALSLFVTTLLWQSAEQQVHEVARRNFDDRAALIRNQVMATLVSYQQALIGVRGLFALRGDIDNRSWQNFLRELIIEKNLHNIVSIDYARYLRPQELPAFVDRIRQHGFPDYHVWPPGKRNEYTAIIYMTPFDERNRKAFGYDMLSEPRRHAAMDLARDTGKATVTRLVHVIQGRGSPGFIMYAATYRPGAPINTVAERRKALLGYIYSPVLMKEFLQGVMSPEESELGLEVYDGRDKQAVDRFTPAVDVTPAFQKDLRVHVLNRTWTLHFYSLPAFEANEDHQYPLAMLLSGFCISILLFFIILFLDTTRARAEDLAQEMTLALRDSEELYRTIFEQAATGIGHATMEGRIIRVNQMFATILGYSTAELRGMSVDDITYPDDREISREANQAVYTGAEPNLTYEKRYLCKDGAIKWVKVSLSACGREVEHRFLVAIVEDITERRHTAEQLRNLSVHLQQAREQERARIAREIHDELGGELTAIKYELSKYTGDETPGPHIDPAALHLVDDAIAALRRIIADLRPSVLDDLGLWAALEWLVSEFGKRTGIQTEFHFRGPEIMPAYDQATAIFRIVQELLTNVAKHAGATRVRIAATITCLSDLQGYILVEDNGQGISDEALHRKGSYGLLGIRERVQSLNGKFFINGIPQEGTVATIQFPISHPVPSQPVKA